MTFKFGQLSIDPAELGSQGNAILGIRDSGKSYTATELAEKLFEAGIPFVAFDPIGIWRFMKVPGKGKGYPVVVAGGKHPDLPLTVAGAPGILRAAMNNGVSLVIDLFDINLSKADWKRIVTSCLRVLLHENQSLRHVFIEEAAEFAPQRVGPDQGQVYAEVEKLARMGGNSRLGYTLINQRAEEVNKAVLELCDNLFLHRQKGRNSLTALSKWLDIGAVKDHKAIIESLSTLPTGECWAWLAGTEAPIRVKVPAKNSFHPDRRTMRGAIDVKVKASVDVAQFVSHMRESLGKIEEEANANDPTELRRQVAELKRQLNAPRDLVVDSELLMAKYQEGYNEAVDQVAEKVLAEVRSLYVAAEALLKSVGEAIDRIKAGKTKTPAPQMIRFKAAHTNTGASIPPNNYADTVPSLKTNGAASKLSKAARSILSVLAQHPEGCASGKLTLLTGYSYSGSFQNALSELRTNGCIEGENKDVMRITAEGRSYGPFPALPRGAALVEYWANNPRFSKAARQILSHLTDGDSRTADQLCNLTGYSYSGSFQNALSELRTAGVIEGRNSERMRISQEIVP